MRQLTYAVLAGFLVTIVTCTNPAANGKSKGDGDTRTNITQDTKTQPGRPGWVRLTNGQAVRGKIISVDDKWYTLEDESGLQQISAKHVVGYGYDKDTSGLTVSTNNDDASRKPLPPSSWYPRLSGRDRMDQIEVTFFDPHPWAGDGSCVGQLGKVFEESPELVLFGEPGGRLVLHDPKLWGYHSHLFPGDTLQRPVEKPGLTIDIPKSGLPQSVAFVSPAQENQNPDNPKRTSYAIPDAVYAKILDLSAADATLASQYFSGGKPKETTSGSVFAFSLPRNDRQCWVYLFDGAKKHGKILAEAYAAYGDAVLAPDIMIDMVAGDGTVVGRVMLLPIPDFLSADGPAPLPISILVGKDAAVVTTVPVPPRQSVVLPPKAPSTRADVNIYFYEVSKTITEKIITAYGTGRPNKDVTVKTRALTQRESDEHIRIDVSSLPADRYPAVAWLFLRRSYVWRDGGFLPNIQPMPAPPLREKKPAHVISNKGRIPHVLPILFVGPDPGKGDDRSLLDSPVVGGMSNALLGDALQREAGLALQTLNTLGNIGDKASDRGDKGDSVTSVTNVYITIPPHTGITDGGSIVQPQTYDLAPGTSPWIRPGGAPMRGWSYTDGYSGKTYYDPSQFYDQTTGNLKPGYTHGPGTNQVTYNPTTGSTTGTTTQGGTGVDFGGVSVDPLTGNVVGVNISPRRRSGP